MRMQRAPWLSSLLALVACAVIAGCAAVAPLPSPSAALASPSPSASAEVLYPYRDAACDPDDPRIAAAKIVLPKGDGPEARIAAACVALEWLENDPPNPTLVTELRGPTVHPQRNVTDKQGLLAMERLIGRRFQQPGSEILLLVIGSDMEWACTYGRDAIDPRIPRPLPWTDEWLGCGTKQWVCSGSNIGLTDGTRFIFGACPKSIIDGSKAPAKETKWNGLRSGHELIQILFFEMTSGEWGVPRGRWGGLTARSAGVQYYERAAAWLAGTPRDWRFDEAGSGQYNDARDVWKEWRKTEAETRKAFDFSTFVQQDWNTVEDPAATLSASVTAFAGEYLIAHWGTGALFSWLSGEGSFEQVYGQSENELFEKIGAYVQQQFDGSK